MAAIFTSIAVLLIHLLKIDNFEKICTICIENGDFIGFSKMNRKLIFKMAASIGLIDVRILIFELL